MILAAQTPYLTAIARGMERLCAQDPANLAALGATRTADGRWTLPVLNALLAVDPASGRVARASGEPDVSSEQEVGVAWRILVLHYLAALPPSTQSTKWVSFADLPDGRGYEQVYRARVVNRLCVTAGRSRNTFVSACERLDAQRVSLGDDGFQFTVFPLLPVTIAWYSGDGELPPNASFLYPENILSFFPIEDIIVLSERLVGALQGKGW